MFTFELPEIGEGVVEGEIVQWLVKPGDAVAVDQPLCEVMTDKATVEISSPRAGVVAKVYADEGDVMKVHTPLVDIDEDGSAAAAPAPAASPEPEPAAQPARAEAPAPQPAVAPPAPAPAPEPAAPAAEVRTGGKTLATPAVRSHARAQGVDIDIVAGSGPKGRVTRADIDAHAAAPVAFAEGPPHAEQIRAPVALEVPPSPEWSGQDTRQRIIGLRRKIAQKMAESYRLAPHFCYVDEVDATELVALRRALKPAAEARGVKLTYLAFIMKALAIVLRDFPSINANMDEENFELVLKGTVNIGIATDTPAGLYVPVVKHVERKSILELAHEVAELTERTRAGKAALSDFQGGSFTITSMGNIGGRFATPIINHPEVAILGVNQIHDRPMVVDGAVVPRKMMYLSPSFDHRVIDGAVAARFVSALKAILEQPESLLLELR